MYKLYISNEYKVSLLFKVLGSCFIKCQSSFLYVVKDGSIGFRIFSVRKLKACAWLFGPVTIGLLFKSFGFETFMIVSLSFCDIAY